jgi:hypothetical protein
MKYSILRRCEGSIIKTNLSGCCCCCSDDESTGTGGVLTNNCATRCFPSVRSIVILYVQPRQVARSAAIMFPSLRSFPIPGHHARSKWISLQSNRTCLRDGRLTCSRCGLHKDKMPALPSHRLRSVSTTHLISTLSALPMINTNVDRPRRRRTTHVTRRQATDGRPMQKKTGSRPATNRRQHRKAGSDPRMRNRRSREKKAVACYFIRRRGFK